MIRITNKHISSQVAKNIKTHSKKLNEIQNQITSQNRIQKPSQDPNGMSLLMSYKSQLNHYQRYEGNIEEGNSRLNIVDSKIQEIINYIQEIRQNAIQGANGTLTKSDREKIAVQIEQYLRQIVQVSNSKYKGESLFAGHKSNIESYKVSFEKTNNLDMEMISKVEYKGDIGYLLREIDRGEYIKVSMPGNRIFWSSNQRIGSQTVSTGYMAESQSNKPYQIIQINNTKIRIDNQDNLQSIVDKINQSKIAVKAKIDNTSGEDLIILETTKPHQLILKDLEGGKVLQDLGLISQGNPSESNNYAPSAIVSGDSLFDSVIKLREALLNNNINKINSSIGNLDEVLENLTSNLSVIGARQKRLEVAQQATSKSILYSKEAYSKIQSTDMTQAITDMKNVELSHQAALQIGARLIRSTLLDFIK